MRTIGVRSFALVVGVWGVVAGSSAAASTVYRVQLQTHCNTFFTREPSGLISANRTYTSSGSPLILEDKNGAALLHGDVITLMTPNHYVGVSADTYLRANTTAYNSRTAFQIFRTAGPGTLSASDEFYFKSLSGGLVILPQCPSPFVRAIGNVASRLRFAYGQLARIAGHERATAMIGPNTEACTAAPVSADAPCGQCGLAQNRAYTYLTALVPLQCQKHVFVGPCTSHGCP